MYSIALKNCIEGTAEVEAESYDWVQDEGDCIQFD
jgi:hypothetical protein